MATSSLVFLPGFMCDARLFAPQHAHLSALGHDCHVGDLTGAATIERMAANVLRRAPESFGLVGLSMGGIVAFEIMRREPERVTHLALLNTTARRDAAGAQRQLQMKRVVAGELDLVLRQEMKPQYLAPMNRTPELLDCLDAMGRALGEEAFIQQSMALTTRHDAFDVMPGIVCPTLVLVGADDQVCPIDRHEEIADRIPGASLTVVANCGHISTLERPDAVNTALELLLTRRSAAADRFAAPLLKIVPNDN